MQRHCHYEKGTENKIAFVFSCPGAKEECCKKPAAGQTGKNLERLCSILNSKFGNKINWSRECATITNSWSKVEYKQRTGRTEPTNVEILSTKNLLRLENEIKDISKVIICCGESANLAVIRLANMGCINPFAKVIKIRHLGFQSINQIKRDVCKKPIHSVNKEKKTGNRKTRKQIGSDNTTKRLETIADKITNNLSLLNNLVIIRLHNCCLQCGNIIGYLPYDRILTYYL